MKKALLLVVLASLMYGCIVLPSGYVVSKYENISDNESVKRVYENNVFMREYKYFDKKLVGMVLYYPSGAIEGVYDGKDTMTYYYESGAVEIIFHIENNVFNGKSVEYYESGEIEITGQYDNGSKTGTFITYSKNGNVKKESMYDNDLLVSERYYRPNGKLMFDDITYKDGKIVSGYCVLSGTDKKVPLSIPDITNWNRGYDVNCP